MANLGISILHHSSANVRLKIADKDEFVCKAWEIGSHVVNAKYLSSHSHLQFLTSMEADACINAMFDALDLGGKIEIIVPDADYHMRQWLDADWNEGSLRDLNSPARQSFAGLFGWQQGGNPMQSGYGGHYDDCHKSAYNKRRLEFLLLRAGFVDIGIAQNVEGQITAIARKTMCRGERQISPNMDNIRLDHINRYKFAASSLSRLNIGKVLDLACGIGYGAKLLAEKLNAQVTAVDLDKGAVEYANLHYLHPLVNFICADARNLDIPNDTFDAIVSFETIEHIDFDEWLLKKFCDLLHQNGYLVLSTPNQDVLPYNPERFPYHIKHYKVNEISSMLERAGFGVVEIFTQYDAVAGEVLPGNDGAFTIILAKKL